MVHGRGGRQGISGTNIIKRLFGARDLKTKRVRNQIVLCYNFSSAVSEDFEVSRRLRAGQFL